MDQNELGDSKSNKKIADIKKCRDVIKTNLDKEWQQRKDFLEGVTKDDFIERRHAENYQKVEEDIYKRDSYLRYLVTLYDLLNSMNREIRINSKIVEKVEVEIYEDVLSKYQFGLANQELKDFSSINTSLKFMRKLFKKGNNTTVPKELFENLTLEQKRDLKSFRKMKFKQLLKDGTITKYNKMPQLEKIESNLKVIFFEDENFDIQVQVIFKDRAKFMMCGQQLMKSNVSKLRNYTAVNGVKNIILKFVIPQETVLLLMKCDPKKRQIFGDVLEFNVGKLTNIINHLFRARNANK